MDSSAEKRAQQQTPESDASGAVEIEDVIAQEKERIAAHRQQRNTAADAPYVGLCLSGGGIRSASFALGVLQALERNQLLDKIDYLSSVSGGGYLGSSYTWFNSQLERAGKPWKFPFGSYDVGARSVESNGGLNYLRQHCDYLKPTKSLNGIAAFANFFRNSLLAFAVYFSLLLAVFCFLTAWGAFSINSIALPLLGQINNILFFAVLLALLFVVLTLLYAVSTILLSSMSMRDYWLRVKVQQLLGVVVALFLLTVAIGSLPLLFTQGTIWLNATAGSMSVFGILGSIYEYRRQSAAAKTKQASGSALRVMITAVILVYGLLLAAYAISWKFSDSAIAYGLLLLLLSFVLGVAVNTNYFGPGRFYRDRLMEAFMPGEETVDDNKWRPAYAADSVKMADVCAAEGRGPYHLINCNLILADSDDARYRGRGGDSFILSPLFSGSYATGWFDTKKFINNRMTLATAMSVSGAALNPNAGNNGAGATRNRVASFLLSLFNLRLGYFATNPAATGFHKLLATIFQPNFYYPGLVQGLFAIGLDEKAGYLNLSDGGHFENCGLYEMARRQLDVIIVSQAGADEDYTFADLANAMERVRVDFGYHVHFPDDMGICDVIPGSADSMVGNENIRLAKRGFAIGHIYYSDTHRGTIIYLKAVLISQLPPDLFSYRKLNCAFPNEPTSDQFFDEAQLEAYRELGYQLCKQMATANNASVDVARNKGRWF